MTATRFQKLMSFAVFACSVQVCLGQAAPSPEVFVGYSACHLSPSTGSDQDLNGFSFGGRYSFTPSWSVEAAVSHHLGSEAGSVELRQWTFLAGPRLSQPFGDKWEGFIHFLVGEARLKASDGSASDQSTSFAFSPGLGVDFAFNRNLSLRGHGDYVVTHYAGNTQRSPCLFLGLAISR